jgi:glycosyltransferase involved in cell wall biosynthesis
MNCKVSVVIPTFNRAHTLTRAIESVLKQTFKNFDLWIVDDCSTDDTFEIVSRYTKENSNIHYRRLKMNKGVSHARNIGSFESEGEWLGFLDSDDEWFPDKLQKQVDFMEGNKSISLIHGEEIWIRNGRRVNPKIKYKKFGGNIFENCLALCLIGPSTTLIKRELYQEMEGFNEDFPVCEDYDLWLRITSLYPVGFIEAPLINKYGGHEDQLSLKFKAMDYWRILSMFGVFNNRKLSKAARSLLINEVQKKGKILLGGYKKHSNESNSSKVIQILELCCE